LILLDTHVWIWWSTGSDKLAARHSQLIDAGEPDGITVSAFSVWEVAMLVAKNRIDLGQPLQGWLDRIAQIPTMHILPATPQILVDSTILPGEFHADPADRIIVATARAHDATLLTNDSKILAYQHARSVGPTDLPAGGTA
jgi:PIN domain nuclease of toxin-antitoxin system